MPKPSRPQRRHRPRFQRAAPPPFQLTPRDIAIVREVARHRFLRSTQISAVMNMSHKKTCHRLNRLYHAGYLDRPRVQIEYHVAGGGSAPMVYGLGPKARLLLNVATEVAARRTMRGRSVGRVFLLHTLAIADFRIAIQTAAAVTANIAHLDFDQVLQLAPQPTQTCSNPFAWKVAIDGLVHVSATPDDVFALRLGGNHARNFLVEIDRGTMPIERASFNQTSVLRKLVTYEIARQQRLHARHYGWTSFRVLVLTSSAERAAHIRAAIARSPRLAASPLFLVAAQTEITASTILKPFWIDGSGKSVALI